MASGRYYDPVARYDYIFKVILLGAGGTGKTTFYERATGAPQQQRAGAAQSRSKSVSTRTGLSVKVLLCDAPAAFLLSESAGSDDYYCGAHGAVFMTDDAAAGRCDRAEARMRAALAERTDAAQLATIRYHASQRSLEPACVHEALGCLCDSMAAMRVAAIDGRLAAAGLQAAFARFKADCQAEMPQCAFAGV